MRLVLGVHDVAMRLFRRIEDDGHVGRSIGPSETVGKLPQHRRITVNGARRRAVAVRERRQSVISAEDIARAIDQIEVRASGRVGFEHEGKWFSRVAELWKLWATFPDMGALGSRSKR